MKKGKIGLGLVLLAVLALLAVPQEGLTLSPVHQKAVPPLAGPTILATKTDAPEPARVRPSPTATPPPPVSFFQKMMAPFVEMAWERRQKNPVFQQCADPELNGSDRLNIVVFVYVETFEPTAEKPNPPPAIIGSPRFYTWDLKNNTLTAVSLTHDIRCPECEEASAKTFGQNRRQTPLLRLDQAYLHRQVGNFALLQKTLACATGLWPDYQIAFADDFIVNTVDNVFGGIWVDVPQTLDVEPFYFQGRKYDETKWRHFEKGWRKFDGLTTLAYIKTVPVPPPGQTNYPPEWEHQVRADTFFAALLKTGQSRFRDRSFWEKMLPVIVANKVNGKLDTDFELLQLITHGDKVAKQFGELGDQNLEVEHGFPVIVREIYIVDSCCSRDQNLRAVRWVHPYATDDAWMVKDFASGYYAPDILGVEVPYNANPYAKDLAHDYWASVREAVKKALTETGEKKIPPAE